MTWLKLWADMHSNIHHEQISHLPIWLDHARKTMDFWPIAYYPFQMRKLENGFAVEDVLDRSIYLKDWEYIRKICDQANAKGFPMFMGYEWQGNGKDGDHNVFFLDNRQSQEHPMTYRELLQIYRDTDAIAIPHHVAYQRGSRGKNWDSHDERFSPFAEIFSSHGLSESDPAVLPMDRHVHMGPRVSDTSYQRGLDKGYRIGCIASGDNHVVPGTYGYGMMCALAESSSKEDIWDALIHSRVYGVSHSRIDVDFSIDDKPMGSEMKHHGSHLLQARVEGSDRIRQIDIIKNDRLIKVIVPERREIREDLITFKVRIEFGWGPDIRVFPEETEKHFKGSFKVREGEILSIEKCFANFGEEVTQKSHDEAFFDLTTYQSTNTGKWMGSCVAANESLIFEARAPLKSETVLSVNGKEYTFKVSDLLEDSHLLADMEEADQLIRSYFGKVEHYRNDPWWHNSCKIKIHRACPKEYYSTQIREDLEENEDCLYRLVILQENGNRAWTSPIFMRGSE